MTTEPFLREVGLPFASVNEAPTSAKRTFGLARAASDMETATVESVPTIRVQPAATSEAGAPSPDAAS